LELLLCLLEIKGYRPQVAMDGETALEFASKYCFDLIIMDLKLPKIDGFEVLKRLKTSLNSNTPVIVITACVTDEVKKSVLAEGCTSYLTKPFSTNHFYDIVSLNLATVTQFANV
ncbi:MAG: response regulator, partial [Methanolobus sp.]|nr:response regulator [Methanolobus sp.]